MNKCLAVLVIGLVPGVAADAATLTPVAVQECVISPGVPSTVRWKIQSGPIGGIEYVVCDYAEKQVAAGRAEAAGDGMVKTILNLPQGFHEIRFPATKQRFGIIALPENTGKDPFFAIDGGLSWLVRDAAVREGLICVAKRVGIDMIRERLTWGAVHPAPLKWDWQGPAAFDTLRQAYVTQGVKVLEMAHDGPAWMGRVSVYPQDLAAAARSWQAIADHWRPAWGAVELWNEPDILFGGNLPADQYAAVAKALAYGLAEKKVGVPLVGGVMAVCNRRFLDTVAENDLLDYVDAFSFHSYGHAMEMEGLVAKYRDWLQAHKRPGMPLWITECGRPWKKGPERAPAGEDAESALDITMKGVEARVCGIERYFPFVYPYYEENDNNFGMMDKHATPLRSLAAYAQSIRILHGSRYGGDLKVADKAIQRARVFSTEGDRHAPGGLVAVIYTGRRDPQARVKLNVPVVCLEGIDGRLLSPVADEISVPDGLAYAWLSQGESESRQALRDSMHRIQRATSRHGDKAQPALRTRLTPIVMRYLFDGGLVEPNAEGYRIKAAPAGKMPVAVRVFNLSDTRRRVRLQIDWVATAGSVGVDAARRVSIAPQSSVDAAWDVDFTNRFASERRVKIVLSAVSDLPEVSTTHLALGFSGEASLRAALHGFGHWYWLPIRESSHWTPAVGAHGTMHIDATPEAAWRLRVQFGEGDRWVYPVFKLPDGVRMEGYSGMVIRARCHTSAEVRIFLWEGDAGVGYITPQSIVPADGQWHLAVIRFADLVLSTANSPDPNNRLDLDQVRRISIGMNSKAAENTLEVSDACLVTK